jgi:hypothetical protein
MDPMSNPNGRIENRPPATTSFKPNLTFNIGKTDPIITIDTPKRSMPAKTEIKATVLLLIF